MASGGNSGGGAWRGILGAPARFGTDNVMRALRASKTGEVISLNLPLGYSALPPGRSPFARTVRLHNHLRSLGNGRYAVINDDEVSLSLQGSSQWDALAHIGAISPSDTGVFFGGRDLSETSQDGVASELGIEAMGPAIVSRGVLLDFVEFLSPDTGYLDADCAIDRRTVEQCFAHQSVDVLPGDAVLVYTGFERRLRLLNDQFPKRTAGLDQSTVDLWKDVDPIALVSDSPAVERTPMDFSIHIGLLRDLGIALGELWALEYLAEVCRADDRYDFALVSVPLNIPGAFGSTANAIAIR